MTLSEMAAYVCTKVNQTESEDVTACKNFLTQRHKLVWNDQLWKDSLVEYRQTLSPDGYTVTSNWLPDLGVLLLPSDIQRVIAVRNETRHLNVQRPEIYYRSDFDAFARTGTARDFVLLPPCIWQLQEAATLYLARYTSDAGTQMTFDLLDADGVNVTRDVTDELFEFVTLGSSARIDSLLKSVSDSPFYILHEDAAVTASGAGQALANGEMPLNGTNNGFAFFGSEDARGSSTSYSGQLPGIRVAGGVWQVMAGRQPFGTFDVTYVTSASPTPPLPTLDTTWASQVAFDDPAPTFSMSGLLLTIPAADTSAPRRQRIRFIEIPTSEMIVRVLGKRSVPQFDDDNDQPAINGSDNLLLALAEHDMWRRSRQFGFANDVLNEVNSLFEQLKRAEVVQQAHNQRIIPEDGYGDVANLTSQSPLTF